MKIEINAMKFNLAMSFRQFCALEDKADYFDIEKLLHDLPVDSLEYNGHFGANFFFTVEAGRDSKGEWEEFSVDKAQKVAAEVEKRLTEFLKRWKNYKRPGYEDVK